MKKDRDEGRVARDEGEAGAAHEALCTQCGKCCYKKLIIGRKVYITPFPCDYLDTATNLCTIYDKRHEIFPECLTLEQGFKTSAFPEDCAYVPVLAPKNYKPARENYDWNADWEDFDEFADDMECSPAVRETLRARGPDAPPMYVEAFARVIAGEVPTLAALLKAALPKSEQTI